MKNKIEYLETLLEGGSSLIEIADLFKEIAMSLTESVYTDRSILELKN